MDVLETRKRRFIAWHMPGHRDTGGRVELLRAHNFNEPEGHLPRTAEAASIPAGVVLEYVVEEEPTFP